MKYQYLIIDFNNLFWRCTASSIENYIDLEGLQIFNNTIALFFQRVRELRDQFGYETSEVYFLCDNPESHINIRKLITEGTYKHSRESKGLPINFYKTLNALIEIIRVYSDRFRIIKGDHLEADDLTYPLLKYLNDSSDKNFLVISVDMDWARNIDSNVHWFNYSKVYDKHEFIKKYGFNPIGKSIQLWKALKGDTSDCIENVIPFLPDEVLKDILNSFKDINDFYKNFWSKDYPQQWKIKLKEAEAKVRLNYQLVDFILVENLIEEHIYYCTENLKSLHFWFNALQLPMENRLFKISNKPFFEKKKVKRI